MALKIVYWATTIIATAMLLLDLIYLTVLPGLRLLKEWAYAGVSFAWSMAFLAHRLAGDGAAAFFPRVLLALLIVSYLTRPASRRLGPTTVPSMAR